MKWWYVYIIANKFQGTIYIWVTNNLIRRIIEHKEWSIEWFSKKYFCKHLIYYEYFEEIELAIQREKYLKWLKRDKKIAIIESINPDWKDLFDEVCEIY